MGWKKVSLLAVAVAVVTAVAVVVVRDRFVYARPAGAGEIDSLAAQEWDSARARWDARGSTDYRFVWSRIGMVGERATLVEVRDRGRTVTSTPLDEFAGAEVARGRAGPTIEGTFALVREAQRQSDAVEVSYHPDLGHPTRVSVDDRRRGGRRVPVQRH